LPLHGSNYQLTVGKNRHGAGRQITKHGDTIRVRSANPANQLTLQVQSDGLTWAQDGHQPTEVYKRADQVAVRRPTGQSVVFSKLGNEIMVNRPGLSQDVYFSKTENGLNIDRYGYLNDVEIKSVPDGVSIRHGDSSKNTLVSMTDGLEFDPVAFQEETTLDPHALALLDKWFESGIQPTDLVTLTQKGEILEADGLFR
jgi:hypothetical protein